MTIKDAIRYFEDCYPRNTRMDGATSQQQAYLTAISCMDFLLKTLDNLDNVADYDAYNDYQRGVSDCAGQCAETIRDVLMEIEKGDYNKDE